MDQFIELMKGVCVKRSAILKVSKRGGYTDVWTTDLKEMYGNYQIWDCEGEMYKLITGYSP